MATGDLAYLRLDCASLLGVNAFASLPAAEQAQVDALINEAYRECFLTPEGKRPRWSERYVSYVMHAPVTFTATLTNGLKTMASPTGITMSADYAGSVIKIGTTYYTYAGKDATSPTPLDVLLEPWDGTTGVTTCVFYYSSYVLPVEAIDLCDEPEVLGVGRLSPMTGRGQEIRNREYTSDNFIPESGGRWPLYPALSTEYQAGTPVFYFIDSASLHPADTFVARHRFTVYPLPDTVSRTIRMRANIVPAAMTTSTEVPVLPGNAVTDILLPIARAKVAQVITRFNGNNKSDLIAQGRVAHAKLDTLASPQKRGKVKAVVRHNW